MKPATLSNDRQPVVLLAIIFTIWASLFLLRWTAPSDLLDKDQERPAAYMADAALNGNWIVQVDDRGRVCSKPPVYTWMGAGIILLTGRINEFALYFPSALGVLGCCLLIWLMGRQRMGPQAAFLGAAFLMLSPIGMRILYLARTDALFSFTTFLTVCLGYGCWRKGWRWIWFWLAATITTLTKGPLGLVLAMGGFIGLLRQKQHRNLDKNAKLDHIMGVLLFLIIGLGWLWLAYQQLGDAVIEKIIGIELYGHADWSSKKYSPGASFLVVPTLYFFSRFFPWSLPAWVGLWRVWKKPAHDNETRCFERYMAAYFCFGLVLFTLFPHQRPDHLFPLLPAASLLGGRVVTQWFEKRARMRYLMPAAIGLWMVMLVGYSVYYFKIDPNTNPWFAKTAGIQQLAERYVQTYGETAPLHFVDVPYGLQFNLNTMKQRISYQTAAQLLHEQPEARVAVLHPERLKASLPSEFALEEMMRWPYGRDGFIYILRRNDTST